jgi:hypothetical protein
MNIKLKYFSWLLCLLFVVVLYSCAPSDATGISKTYGFWGGVCHGFIFGFALLGKIPKGRIPLSWTCGLSFAVLYRFCFRSYF